MKLNKLFSSLFLAFLSISSYAATQIAPSNRVNLFLDSTSPFATSDWTNATSTTIGAVKVLKSTGNTEFYLKLSMSSLNLSTATSTFVLDAVSGLGTTNSRISERSLFSSYPGQCVAFAKSMIGNTSPTSKWHTGTKISSIPLAQRASQLLPGTMIAYFDGQSVYPSTTSSHVAIVLSVSTDGITVVDQNFINGFALTVGTAKYSASSTTLIGKHFMPWTDTSARRAAGEYHIVDLY